MGVGVIGLGSICTVEAASLSPANSRPVAVLSQLDIDGDGFPDATPDSDGDGLTDNMEEGGSEGSYNGDRVVPFPAPGAVRSAQIPSFLLSRAKVTTKANQWDTDGDGLSDFVEVFGLVFIDDNKNGVLDFIYTDSNQNGLWDPGEAIDPRSEWYDFNGDGLPSIGEYPFENLFAQIDNDNDGRAEATYVLNLDTNGDGKPDAVDENKDGVADVFDLNKDGVSDTLILRLSDFDGFVFTDPTKWDTDDDGIPDGEDRDPLVNAATVAPAFGSGFDRAIAPSAGDQDLDNDGLGDGSDFGNDLFQYVDFPSDIASRMSAAQPDRVSNCETPTLPEAMIEDMLNDDWDGNGMWRLNDSVNYRRGIAKPAAGAQNCMQKTYGAEHDSLFVVNGHKLYAENPTLAATLDCKGVFDFPEQSCAGPSNYAGRGIGMGWQERLLQSARSGTDFFPDVHLWAILYAWRMPGFDINGNGHVGAFGNNFSTDDLHAFGAPIEPTQSSCGGLCGPGLLGVFGTLLSFSALKVGRLGIRRDNS